MIVYLDASALVKRYVREAGSELVTLAFDEAEAIATAGISKVEVTAAFARAQRLGALSAEKVQRARENLDADWTDFLTVPADEIVLRKAAFVAWDFGLRGYDAVQLASALALQEMLLYSVSFMTFDRQLWTAANSHRDVESLPEDLPTLLDRWKSERSLG